MHSISPFHIAIPVRDIPEARQFYAGLLGCEEGRSTENWIDFNLYGHQFVVHYVEALGAEGQVQLYYNDVDKKGVPVPHQGVVLNMQDWESLKRQVMGQVKFVIEPYIRFKGKPGEQATMFFLDPSGNALEFKAFENRDQLFAT